MRDHYDFSESVKNPYAKKLKKQVTIRQDEERMSFLYQNLRSIPERWQGERKIRIAPSRLRSTMDLHSIS